MPTMAETLRGDLLAVARTYAAAKRLRMSSLGNYARGDSSYFRKLEHGDNRMVAEVYDEIMQWLSDRWPEGARWPPHVGRPAPKAIMSGPKREKAITVEKVKTRRKDRTT